MENTTTTPELTGGELDGGSSPALTFGLSWMPGVRGEFLILAFFGLAAILLTWPIAITLDQATGLRGDYFNNLWNAWWVQHSFENWTTPFFTDYLYFPDGLSLKRHTLSPLNSVPTALLRTFLGDHAAFNVWMMTTLAVSGWAFSLFARYLTGSTAGAVLAGLVYTFNPFHFFYICQVNVFTFQYVPLALLFFVRVYREGGLKNIVLAGVFTGCIAGSAEYFVIYTALTVLLLLALGRFLGPAVSWWKGSSRLLIAGVVTGVIVLIVAAPLVYGTLVERGEGSATLSFQKRRANDLFGYYWIGGPEVATVSWPTMLGYSTLALILFSWKRWKRQLVWIVVGAFFLVLSLGKSLFVGQEDQGITLLYGLFAEIPGLSMLRKPDRAFLMIQFVVALLVAESWIAVRVHLKSAPSRGIGFLLLGGVMMFELTGVPFQRYDYTAPAYFDELAKEDDVVSILDAPPLEIDVMNARFNYYQTIHEKKIPLGYCTALALDKRHNRQMQIVVNGFNFMVQGTSLILPRWVEEKGIDRLVLHVKVPMERPLDESIHKQILFKPFFLVRRALLDIRQSGQFIEQELRAAEVFQLKGIISREFGRPVHQDDEVVVWDLKSRREE